MTTTLNLTQAEETTLIRLMDQAECPFHFKCLHENPEDRCKERLLYSGHIVECLAPVGAKCHHSRPWGNSLLCECEIRLFLATAR